MKGQEEVDKLNKRLSFYLKGRKIKLDLVQGVTFTDDEIFLIEAAIVKRDSGTYSSVESPISRRLYLDFIGWDNPEYNDVLICRSRTRKHYR